MLGSLIMPHCVCSRVVTKLLIDIICFLANQEHTGGDPFEQGLTDPDKDRQRERQKLLREQNVLKQVYHLLQQIPS